VPDWSRLVADSLTQNGAWYTYLKLTKRAAPIRTTSRCAATPRSSAPRSSATFSHIEGHAGRPKLTAEFLSNFDRFNLTAQEGYLISLIDGRLDLQKLLILSPFDPFTTLFNLASSSRTRHHGAEMNLNDKYVIAKNLKTPIALVNGMRRGVAQTTPSRPRSAAMPRLADPGGARRGRRERMAAGFFLDADAHRSLDVDIEGRTYRVDKIMQVDDYDTPTVALWFETSRGSAKRSRPSPTSPPRSSTICAGRFPASRERWSSSSRRTARSSTP